MNLPSQREPIWVYPKEDAVWLDKIVKEFRIHPITAQILVSRGFSTFDEINHYLYSKLPDLDDPNLFTDMEVAVKRLAKALKKGEGILVSGDNDVDGMTGTALLADFLKSIGGNVEFYIPNPNVQREHLFLEVLNYALEKKVSLIITVDCGITQAKEISQMTQKGLDVIVTDHHEPIEKMPKCTAILNPKLVGENYPNRHLTGVGVAFKLAHALTDYLISKGEISPKKVDLKVFLDLVALGTIADMGSLLGENRILVRYGLQQLKKTKRLGLTKLFDVCGVNRSEITIFDIATKIAPRMNSLGRVADPRKGVELLLAREEENALNLAQELDLFNIERQKMEQVVANEVETLLTNPEILKNRAIVLSSSNWHPGVIPIISARIAKQFNRPTILIAIDNGIGKGSARTIHEFPLLPVLKKFSDLMINYGGHDFAAGLMIKEENIEKFKKRFIHAANSALREQDLISKLHIDAYADFKELTYDLLASLELFEPYGNENLQPTLYCEAKQAWPPKVIGDSHLKLYLEQGDRVLEGIAFGMADRASSLRKKNITLKIAYTPQINRFHNKSSIQLFVKDFQIKE